MRLSQIEEAQVERETGEIFRHSDRHKLLLKYSGDPSIFVHFTDINKLGINPLSTFNTPIGIYAYSVDYVLNPSTVYGSETEPFQVPFAGNRKYAQVFRVKDLSKCWIIAKDGSTDISIQCERSIRDVERYVRELILTPIADMERPPELPRLPMESKIAQIIGNDRLDEAKLNSILTHTAASVVKLLHDPEYRRTLYDYKFSWGSMLDFYTSDSLLWRFTHNAAKLVGGNASVAWSKIIMSLGIDGVIDNGTKTIHPNEPHQAVFFKVSSLDHLDSIINTVDPYRKGKQETLASKVRPFLTGIAPRNERIKIAEHIRNERFQKVGITHIYQSSWVKNAIGEIDSVLQHGPERGAAFYTPMVDVPTLQSGHILSDYRLRTALVIARRISNAYNTNIRETLLNNLNKLKSYVLNRVQEVEQSMYDRKIKLEYIENIVKLLNEVIAIA